MWAHHRQLLDRLGEPALLANRPVTRRTLFELHAQVFIDGVGLGPVKSLVPRLASGAGRVRRPLGFGAAERSGLTMGLPLPLLPLFLLLFDLRLRRFQWPLPPHVLQRQTQDTLHGPLAGLSQPFQLLQPLRRGHEELEEHKRSRNPGPSGKR